MSVARSREMVLEKTFGQAGIDVEISELGWRGL
jgi:hypothetical protein